MALDAYRVISSPARRPVNRGGSPAATSTPQQVKTMSKLRDTILLLPLLALTSCALPPIALHDAADHGEAVATIIMPEQLEVVTVNGLEIEGTRGLLAKGGTTLEVSPGRYEVLAFYRELWDRVDQHDMLRSDPALFVVDAAPGQRYRLDYERPGNEADAHALAASFKGWVEDLATGARTPSVDSHLRFRRGLVAAASFDDTLVAAAETGAAGQRVAPLPESGEAFANQSPADVATVQQPLLVPEAPLAVPSPALEPAAESAGEQDWLALMKSWWNEASTEERRDFLRWVGERR